MSHEIDMSNDRENMAYTGHVPWHGLGRELPKGADIETWREAAGLTWKAEVSPAMFSAGDEMIEIPNRFAIYRDDTMSPLGLVSGQYKIVQPGEVLEFFRDLVGAGGFELETAGVLAGGGKIWALASIDRNFRIRGQDEVRGYLLLATSLDRSMATQAKFTSVRVVCSNTLEIAGMDNVYPSISVPHHRTFDPKAVKAQLGVSDQAWDDFQEVAETLASRSVSTKEAQQWLIDTFGDPEQPLEEQPRAKLLKKVWESVEKSPGSNLRSADGTAWGLVNGVTHYVDHTRGREADSRLQQAWFGEGSRIKKRAMENAIKLVA